MKLIKMNTGDVFMGAVEVLNDNEWKISKPYSIMQVQGGMTITPIDVSILQSEEVAFVNIFVKNIQYYTDLSTCPMYYDAYQKATTTILGTEEKKIIL